MCPKIVNIGNFQTHFAILRYLRGPLVAILAQILVEELTSEMRKMWGNLKFLHDHEISQLFHNQIT